MVRWFLDPAEKPRTEKISGTSVEEFFLAPVRRKWEMKWGRPQELLVTAGELARLVHAYVTGGLRKRAFDEQASKEDRLVHAGALAVSVAAILQLLQVKELGAALSFSVLCFAISLPFLSMGVYLATLELDNKSGVTSVPLLVARSLGLLATFAGLVGIFWHFHPLIGVLSLVLAPLAFSLAMGAKDVLE